MSAEAKIIADSISPEGVRLTTMEVRIHRFVLAEFNTHRVFSRNSASSRAIPVHKQIQRIIDDPAIPVSWPAEQPGMQGGAEIGLGAAQDAEDAWNSARMSATDHARDLVDLGVHKSVTNRLLEPFMWHTVVVTATAWENFFALRLDADAQPEIRVAAEAMKAAYDASTPTYLMEGDWHLPYFGQEDWAALRARSEESWSAEKALAAKISSARCARTSYLTHDGKRDLNEDLRLYDRLVTDRLDKGLAIHWSPLEHVATPWPENRQVDGGQLGYCPQLSFNSLDGKWTPVDTSHLPRVGNLLGWRSLRTEVEASVGARTFA